MRLALAGSMIKPPFLADWRRSAGRCAARHDSPYERLKDDDEVRSRERRGIAERRDQDRIAGAGAVGVPEQVAVIGVVEELAGFL